jgi:cell division protein FtsI/penicillin-binding protein 2
MLGNGGVRMKPRLIKSVGVQETPPKPMGQIVQKTVADEVLHIMESVIETKEGTGKTLRIPGYRLAGKTGTAQKLGGGVNGYVSSFIGFVPARNPQACILVMVDNPTRGKIYGAAVAGPVFRSLAEEVIEQFQIPPTEFARAR